MPINLIPIPEEQPQSIWAPDIRPDDNITDPVLISQEQQDVIPANFDSLPPEEQERIKNRIRFRGIRLRADLKDETIKLTDKTLDLP
jgi:hypothetical protein